MEGITQLIILLILSASATAQNNGGATTVDVGVILDLNTLVGKIGQTSISMAIDDFYASHRNYTTRLVLHTRDSNSDLLQAASSALDLLENTEAKAIIGPQKSAQAVFTAEVATKARVPLLSFSATSPSISSVRTPYFVRTTVNDSSQVPAITALVEAYRWRAAVPIYEDTDYGRDIVPYLIDAFQGIDVAVPYRSVVPTLATDEDLAMELYKLMTMQTRVFVVHMSSSLGSRLFSKAKELGMMKKGYAWIMTDGVTNIVDSLTPSAVKSMQGALGVRTHPSEPGDDFTLRWERRFRQDYPHDRPAEASMYGWWAYDTVFALAMAVEKVGAAAAANSSFLKPSTGRNSTELERLGVSPIGPSLLKSVLETNFRGVSGEFRMIDGQLRPLPYQIINVVGRGWREIGFWTTNHGLSKVLKTSGPPEGYSTSIDDLNPVIWPGESNAVPSGWEIPTSGNKLRIGVPVKDEFREFVDVRKDPITNATIVTGFCIDIFEAVLQKLPYALPYEFIPFEDSRGGTAGSYNDLTYQVYLQRYDAVLGDVTIRANRSLYVDFTLPFTESGVAMIVPVIESRSKNALIFLDPLAMDLWFGTFAFFIYTGFVVWVIEHRINDEFRGSASEQLSTVFYFSFSTMVFAHKEKIDHFLSRLVVIIWVFVVLILTSSYTASLSSMLTVQSLQPVATDLYELQKNGDNVGFHNGSYIEGLLKELKFDESKIRGYNYSSYIDILSKGSKNGGVTAIIHEIPYIKLFLAQHCTGYTTVGPIFKAGGFGMVFPKGSPLVHDISRGILRVIEGDTLMDIEKKWFGDPNACQNKGSTITSNNLNFHSFWGLFLITGVISACCLLICLAMFSYKNWHELRNIEPNGPTWRRAWGWLEYYHKKDEKPSTPKGDSTIHPVSQ